MMRTRWILVILVATPVFMLDQLAKAWVERTLVADSKPISLLSGLLQLAYHENTGLAFGLFPDQSGILSAIAGAILILLAYTYQHLLPAESRWVTVAVGLIFGGGFSNLLDRVRQGYVIDFIQFGWWPVFNLADSAITLGVINLAVHIIFIGDEPIVEEEPPPIDDGLLQELLTRDPDESINRNSEVSS